jgi:hypothetical protein
MAMATAAMAKSIPTKPLAARSTIGWISNKTLPTGDVVLHEFLH